MNKPGLALTRLPAMPEYIVKSIKAVLLYLAAPLALLSFLVRFLLPRIAQRFIRASVIEFTHVHLHAFRHDGHCQMSVTGHLRNTGPFPAVLKCPHPLGLVAVINGVRRTVATIRMPSIRLVPGQDAHLDLTLDAHVIQREYFGLFGADMLMKEEFTWWLEGRVDLSLFPGMTLRSLFLSKQITLPGMAGLKEATIDGIQVLSGSKETLTISADVTLRNASPIALDLGHVQFTLMHEQQPIGLVTINDMRLTSGLCRVQALVQFCPDRQQSSAWTSGRHLLSAFVSGTDRPVCIQGSTKSTTIEYLQPAMASLEMETVMPGLSAPLLQSATLMLFQTNPFLFTAPARLELKNPFDVNIRVCHIQGGVSALSEVIGTMDTLVNIVIPAQASVVSDPLVMKVKMGASAIGGLVQMATSGLFVDVECTLRCIVGDFEVMLDFLQSEVPVQIG